MATKRKTAAKKAPDIEALASETFGFEELRPGQAEAIAELQKGNDCLVVMPTGSGKSAIYQIAGLTFPGITVVVSPLIALQKDQVDAINESEAPEAVVINSTQRVAEAREAREKIEEGQGKYVFLAPEQFQREETMASLQAARVSLFVVDEAHCISEWGHDFRPDYLKIGTAIECLGRPVILALTATASMPVRDEIVDRLCMREPKIFVHGFDRPNIALRVDHYRKEADKLEALVRRVNWAEKPGIVYVATRKNADIVKGALISEGVNADRYHGGLKASERKEIQDRFMAGETEAVVATNAFGMGIDKANVRFVYHYEISDSLDAYYQEIGRAGRDGESAEAVLFFRPEDINLQKFLTGEGDLPPEEFEKVVDAIMAEGAPVDPAVISEEVDLSKRKVTSMLQRLEDARALETLPGGEVQVVPDVDTAVAAQAAAEEHARRKESKAERLRQMQEYADTSTCRREYLLRYFGDDFTGPCGNCDNCQGAVRSADANYIPVDPEVGTRREVA